jgi:hypothetical protein
LLRVGANDAASESEDGGQRLNFRKVMIINRMEDTKMREVCVRAPEYLGCYELPYELGSSGEEIKFEGGLLKVSVPFAKGLDQKILYRPLA